jgi:hypothetical protein
MVFGVPCCHSIRDFIQRNLRVQADHFHHHWYFKRPGTTQFIDDVLYLAPHVLPPAIVRGKGRPSTFKRNAPSSSRQVTTQLVSQSVSQSISQTGTTSHIEISAMIISSSSSSSLSPLEQPWDWRSLLDEKMAKSKARRQQEEDEDKDDFNYFSARDVQPDQIDDYHEQTDLPSASHSLPHAPILPPRAQYNFAAATQASSSKAKSSPRPATAAKHQSKVTKAKKAADRAAAQVEKATKAAQLAQEKLHQVQAEIVLPSRKKRGKTLGLTTSRPRKKVRIDQGDKEKE